MTWMQTVSGKKIDPWHPDPRQIDIEDVAHHLATINRFAGAAREPYSVAQHSIYCARVLDHPYKVSALLHDAGEYLFGDMSRPLKHSEGMEHFRAGEAWLRDLVLVKYGCPPGVPDAVKRVDACMLFTERRDLLVEVADPTWGHGAVGLPFESFRIVPAHWREVKREFLTMFHYFTGGAYR